MLACNRLVIIFKGIDKYFKLFSVLISTIVNTNIY